MKYFKIWFEKKLEATGKSKPEVYKDLGMSRSQLSNYLTERRTPDHEVVKIFINYFSKSKASRKKDLFFLYYGE